MQQLFGTFQGVVRADASAVYDILDRRPLTIAAMTLASRSSDAEHIPTLPTSSRPRAAGTPPAALAPRTIPRVDPEEFDTPIGSFNIQAGERPSPA